MTDSAAKTILALFLGMSTLLIVAGIGWEIGDGPGLMIGTGIGLTVAFFVTALSREGLHRYLPENSQETEDAS